MKKIAVNNEKAKVKMSYREVPKIKELLIGTALIIFLFAWFTYFYYCDYLTHQCPPLN